MPCEESLCLQGRASLSLASLKPVARPKCVLLISDHQPPLLRLVIFGGSASTRSQQQCHHSRCASFRAFARRSRIGTHSNRCSEQSRRLALLIEGLVSPAVDLPSDYCRSPVLVERRATRQDRGGPRRVSCTVEQPNPALLFWLKSTKSSVDPRLSLRSLRWISHPARPIAAGMLLGKQIWMQVGIQLSSTGIRRSRCAQLPSNMSIQLEAPPFLPAQAQWR